VVEMRKFCPFYSTGTRELCIEACALFIDTDDYVGCALKLIAMRFLAKR